MVGATNQQHNLLNQQLLHRQQKKQLTLLDLEGMLSEVLDKLDELDILLVLDHAHEGRALPPGSESSSRTGYAISSVFGPSTLPFYWY